MNKLKTIHEQMKVELHKFPQNVDTTSKSTAVAINQVLETFKDLTNQANKMTKKYLEGQDILTIDYEYYDSLQEYYIYLLKNSDTIYQKLQEITKRTGEYVK